MTATDQPNAAPSDTGGSKAPAPKPRRLAPILVVAAATLGVGTLFYRSVEEFTWLDSVYFCVMMLTTVGYDNVKVETSAGKVFTMFYAVFGVVILATAASYILHQALDRHFFSTERITDRLRHRHQHDDH